MADEKSGPWDSPDLEETSPFQISSSASSLTMIGPYRIAKMIGQGGMGCVYEAEQMNPRRPVALKVIRGGRLVSDEHIRLFRREAQALARLKHPGIAAIYETGRTDDGQHFFAMELIRGIPLSDYLNQTSESVENRLRLFLKICEAINYAHQRAVIHRDLKPSNIMVTTESTSSAGSVPDVKVLDFGLAKITDADMGAATIATEPGQIQGTLAYMSPEQARGNPDEIDLRSDVYSLGVILYEMVAGETPYAVQRVSPLEAQRMILESVPKRLNRPGISVDKDVETIIFKALEKEPQRRYANVAAFADDVERYLTDQPISARPPTAGYQLRKLIKRHRTAFAFVATLAVLLGVFVTSVMIQSKRIAAERDRAVSAEHRAASEAETAKQVSTFMIDLFNVADPSESRGNTITARELLDKSAKDITETLNGQPIVQARLMNVMGRAFTSLGLYDRAQPLVEKALAIRRDKLGPDHFEIAESLNQVGILAFEKGDLPRAEMLFRQALEMRRKVFGAEHLDVAGSLNDLAMTIKTKETESANAEAEPLYREALSIRRRLLGSQDISVAQSLNNLAMFLYANKRDLDQAEPLFREALEINRKVLGEEHYEVGINLNNLGLLLRDKGKYEQAEPILRQSVVIHRKTLGDRHAAVANAINNLANLLQREKKYADAATLYREAIAIDQNVFGDNHWEVATKKSLLGGCLTAMQRYREAEPLLLESYPIIRSNWTDFHPRTKVALKRIIDLYDAWGKPEKAAPYRARDQS